MTAENTARKPTTSNQWICYKFTPLVATSIGLGGYLVVTLAMARKQALENVYRDRVEAAYQRTDLFDRRSELVQQKNDYIASQD